MNYLLPHPSSFLWSYKKSDVQSNWVKKWSSIWILLPAISISGWCSNELEWNHGISGCSIISVVHWKPIIVECTCLQRKWLGSELIWFVFGLHLALVFLVVIFCSCCVFSLFSLIFKANHCGMQRRAGKVRFALSNLCGQFLHFDIFLVVYDLHFVQRLWGFASASNCFFVFISCLLLVVAIDIFLRLFRLHLSWNAETLRFATGSVFCVFLLLQSIIIV